MSCFDCVLYTEHTHCFAGYRQEKLAPLEKEPQEKDKFKNQSIMNTAFVAEVVGPRAISMSSELAWMIELDIDSNICTDST